MEKDERRGAIMSELPIETRQIIENIEKTGSRPYSETKKILDEATKKTIKSLNPKKRGFIKK